MLRKTSEIQNTSHHWVRLINQCYFFDSLIVTNNNGLVPTRPNVWRTNVQENIHELSSVDFVLLSKSPVEIVWNISSDCTKRSSYNTYFVMTYYSRLGKYCSLRCNNFCSWLDVKIFFTLKISRTKLEYWVRITNPFVSW